MPSTEYLARQADLSATGPHQRVVDASWPCKPVPSQPGPWTLGYIS